MSVSELIKKIIPSRIITHKLPIKKSILFTFDDGPHPEITPKIIDILDKNNAKGLFFVLGKRIQRAPELIQYIIEKGHGIGNHSFTHRACNCLSAKEIVRDINRCKEDILSLCGFVTRIYRPPMGIVSPALIYAAECCNHRIMRWSLDTGESSYLKNAAPTILADNFLKNVHESAIILSHDDKDTTPKYLEIVLPMLLQNGYDLQSGLHASGWRNGS